MLFNADTARHIRGGEITLSLRKWQRPQALVGGVYYLRPDGAVEVTSMPETRLGDLPEDDLRLAEYLDRTGVASTLAAGEDDAVWMVRFDFHANLTRPVPGRGMVDDGELETLGRKLARKNENSSHWPWTQVVRYWIG